LLVNGSVGIGTTAPGTAKLYVRGQGTGGFNTIFEDNTSSYCWLQIKASGGGSNSSWQLGSYNNGFNFYNDNNSAYRVFFGDNGNVGIGTTNPGYKLDVDGTIRATGDVIAYSDARVKENVNTITDALSKITSLRGVTYTRKDTDDKSEKIGVIAQEVLEVLPQVVQQDTDGNYSVAYGNMVGVLIEAIKELNTRLDKLENK